MNEPKFTPGPWIVRPNRDHGDNIFSAHKRIANTYGPMDTPEYLANARLIAAAPDLYAACQAALARLIDLGSEQDADTIGPCAATDACRAALRKAEGTP